MAILAKTMDSTQALGETIAGWLKENVFSSSFATIGHLILVGVAGAVVWTQFQTSPVPTGVIAGLWVAGLVWVIASALTHRFNDVSQWLKDRLYNSLAGALTTLIIALVLTAAIRALVDWAFVNASFSSDPDAVAVSEHTGATWGIVAANLKLFLVGQLPDAQLWRVQASVALVAVLAAVSVPVYGPLARELKRFRRWVTWAWLISPPILWLLLRGFGEAGLFSVIETRLWGGLLLTLIISVFAIVVSFPLGVLLALGRRSTFQGIPAWLTYAAVGAVTVWGLATYTFPNWSVAQTPIEYVLILWPLGLLAAGIAFQRVYKGNVVAAFSTVYIEFVRGVPLITVLFMANLMLPLFLPSDVLIENAFRAMWGFTLFSAAYLAENVRGGLQAIPKGQYEAAQALGLNTVQQLWFIILPQALRAVIPPIVGQFIGLFKDTSLVAIVGLFDLLNIANATVAQPDWLGLRREAYAFITIIYYVGCLLMAAVSRWLEKRMQVGKY